MYRAIVIINLFFALTAGCQVMEKGASSSLLQEIEASNYDFTFYGCILDYDTKEPLSGVVVPWSYNYYFLSKIMTPEFGIKEGLMSTDENGCFEYKARGYMFRIQSFRKTGYYDLQTSNKSRFYFNRSQLNRIGFSPEQPFIYYMLKKPVPGIDHSEQGSGGWYDISEPQEHDILLSVYGDYLNRYAIRHETHIFSSNNRPIYSNYYKGDFSDLPVPRNTPLRSRLIADYEDSISSNKKPLHPKSAIWEAECYLEVHPRDDGYSVSLKALNQDSGFVLTDRPVWVAPTEGYLPEVEFFLKDNGIATENINSKNSGDGSIYGIDLRSIDLDIKHVTLKDSGGPYPVYSNLWFYVVEESRRHFIDGQSKTHTKKILSVEVGTNKLGYRYLGHDYDKTYGRFQSKLLSQVMRNRSQKGGHFGIQVIPDWVHMNDKELEDLVESEVQKKYLDKDGNLINDRVNLAAIKKLAIFSKKREQQRWQIRKIWTQENELNFKKECDESVRQQMEQWLLAEQPWLKDRMPQEFIVIDE